MKVIMSEKEMDLMQKIMVSVADQPLIENEVVSITYKKPLEENAKTTVEVEINEKYVIKMYKEANKWLPGIVNAIKGLVALIKSFISSLAETENSLLKNLKPKKAIKDIEW